jgi:hypothetical protein
LISIGKFDSGVAFVNLLQFKIMEKVISKSTISILLFTIAIVLSFMSHYLPDAKTLIWIILTIALIYFFLGWYIFRGYYPEGNPVLLFFMGYLYSGVFIAAVCVLAKWPFALTFMSVAVFFAVAQIVVTIIMRKKMAPKGFIQFLIEGSLMLVMSVLMLAGY